MKRYALALITAVALATSGAHLWAQATNWKQVPIPPLPAFHPQEPKRIVLENGMIIFLQEDHELPLIKGSARIRGGSRSEPADKTGLLDIYGEVWRTGGTKDQTGDQLDDYLEIRAAKVETGSNADSTSISLSCLKADFDDTFRIFVALLRDPEFRADKLDLAQKEMNDSISRRNDDASEIAGRESVRLVYGANNPYAREPEYATVAAVTRADLIDWHQAHVRPNNIILGISGDFDDAKMEASLRQAFGDWAKGPEVKAPDIHFEPAKPGIYQIPRSDVNQSSVRMVELGIRRDNPDYYAAQVFNEAFGGGFSSRLFRNIRTAKGLAYEVGGGIGSSFDHDGIIRFSLGTKSASTMQSIQAVYEQIDDLKSHPISEDEIKLAKDSILNSFVFNFDEPEKVLRERMAYEFYGYPADFLERFRAGVEKVQAADVARVAEKYLHKDQLAVLVVGNTAEFDKPLSSLGTVSNVDISIPPPLGSKAEQAAAPASGPVAPNPEGQALAAKVVQALGGLEKLQSIKSLRATLTENAPQSPTQKVVATIIFPDRMHVNVETPDGPLTIVVTPDAGFVSFPGRGVHDMPPPQKNETVAQIHRDLIFIAQHVNDPAYSFVASGTEKIGGVETRIVDVYGFSPMRWFVDPSSGRVLRESYETVGRAGEAHDVTDLEDWQTADGITLPRLHKNNQNGEPSSTVHYDSIEFNPSVDPRLFEKPAEGK
jgi:zinc protease